MPVQCYISVLLNHSNHTRHTNTSTQLTIYNAHQDHFIYSHVSIIHTNRNTATFASAVSSLIISEYFNISRPLHFSNHTLPQNHFTNWSKEAKFVITTKHLSTHINIIISNKCKKIKAKITFAPCLQYLLSVADWLIVKELHNPKVILKH